MEKIFDYLGSHLVPDLGIFFVETLQEFFDADTISLDDAMETGDEEDVIHLVSKLRQLNQLKLIFCLESDLNCHLFYFLIRILGIQINGRDKID